MTLPSAPDPPRASIVIRAYNEARHLPEVFARLERQTERAFEVVLVDSGSTDATARLAESAGARVVRIRKEDFTFGRSLNVGCEAARGDLLAFISGHCHPMEERWLERMLAPFADPAIGLVYGKQRGGETTKFSERRHFEKTFPETSLVPQEGFFCNNANAAIRRELWRARPFDEVLTGLEDLDWAKWMTGQGGRVAYAADAGVIHLHDETWPQVFRRYEREAIALKHILPDMSFSIFEFARLFTHSAWLDSLRAARQGIFFANFAPILAFRAMQYWGTYRGAKFDRSLTREMKEKFFYPNR
jgi:glycosyltransferase involved in cell wall biosynthesis